MSIEQGQLDFLRVVNRFNYSLQLVKVCSLSCGLFIPARIQDQRLSPQEKLCLCTELSLSLERCGKNIKASFLEFKEESLSEE